MEVYSAVERFTRGYRSLHTQRAYATGTTQFIEWSGAKTVGDLDPSRVMDWVDTLVERELSPRTVQQYVTATIGLMKLAKRREWAEISGDDLLTLKDDMTEWNRNNKVETLPRLPAEPTVIATLTRPPSVVPKDDRDKLYKMRQWALIHMWASTGCRISESANLKRADLNMQNMTALVRGGKGNRDRTIIWEEKEDWDILLAYLTERDKLLEDGFTIVGEEPVFARHDYHAHCRKTIEPMGTGSMRVAHHKWCRGALVSYYKPHSLRHRAITKVLNKTGNMKVAQDYAGHKNVSTTADTYTHLATDELIKAVRGG